MAIHIKGIEMPKEPIAIIIYPDGKVFRVSYPEQIAEAVSVPPHGDLIEYDFCLENYELLHDDDGNPVYAVRMRDINIAPTIIPASEEEMK